MALSWCKWLAGAKYIRIGPLQKKVPVFRTPALILTSSHPSARTLFNKSPGSTMDALRIWKLLEILGMDYCRIVKMRRRMKKFTYPWLAYCVPTAMILALGDFIAQYHLKPHAADRTFLKFLKEEWVVGETLLFALIGFFPIGPLLSKWNLFLYRKMRCYGRVKFLLQKLLLDIFIIAPILLTLMALLYGTAYGKKLYKEDAETIKKTLKEKYWPAVKDAAVFNILTRPVVALGIFYLAPVHLRRMLKSVYEVIFAAYATDTVRKNVYGGPQPTAEKLSENLTTGESTFPSIFFGSNETPQTVEEKPLSRWARYKRWACRNRED